MDDSCAVCAEELEWVAYGLCGHLDVCSNCVVRLRFICNDQHCCICKVESGVIFITKALGDYTKMIRDFSSFPNNPIEGRTGLYWYHEPTKSYFDDFDHYKTIKAMCKLSCVICEDGRDEKNERTKKRKDYKNVDQLRGHLFHRHGLFFCSLCLEGRKIFICEQNLYTKEQLNQHVKTGDSEVDGNESERGGFKGHPSCEFCQNPFYGDNELYLHMSTEHFTCHICQKKNPGQYVYYKNYDDLELHFRHEHFLCEDEACLEKKFIVFTTESEMKRHNTKEHGGRMSRSKRNAALQIPISFQYRGSNEQGRRNRDHGRHQGSSGDQLSLAIQASLQTASAERTHNSSSSTRAATTNGQEIEIIGGSFQLLSTAESSEQPSRYFPSLGQNSQNPTLEGSSFPPLPKAQRKSRNGSQGLAGISMAARLRLRNSGTVRVLNSSQGGPPPSHRSNSSAISSHQPMPSSNAGSSISLSSSGISPVTSSHFASSSRSSTTSNSVNHSASAPNLRESGSLDYSVSKFPPVSTAKVNQVSKSSQPAAKVEDVQSANKALVNKIQVALENDEAKFTAFKKISAHYRLHLTNTGEYLASVYQFGLSHLIPELARLCPDPQKQRELLETYNFNMSCNGKHANGLKLGNCSKKGKEKCETNSSSKAKLPLEKGKSQVSTDKPNQPLVMDTRNESGSSQSTNNSLEQNVGGAVGGNKPRKKIPKFLKNRLGEDAVNSNHGPSQMEERSKEPPEGGVTVRGAWQNGGGRRLLAATQKERRK
ncbi:hypothetical protein ACFE04_027821 [Oxalis oulophora]